jgi:hypothetical protein
MHFIPWKLYVVREVIKSKKEFLFASYVEETEAVKASRYSGNEDP